MKVVKVILYTIWVILIGSLSLLYSIQKEEFKRQNKEVNVLLKEIMPNAQICFEYYQNILILKDKSECKSIVDSIYRSSDFLKNYDEKHKKLKAEPRKE